MKRSTALLLLALAASGFSQTTPAGSPAGPSSATRMADQAASQAMSAMGSGKKVTITVDNRAVPYSPSVVGKMVYVPVRFFQEAGLSVIWDKGDRRASVRDQSGPSKTSIEYDASVRQKNRQPGPSMRPIYRGGTLYVPLASGLAAFGLMAEWIPASSRINVRSSRPGS